MTRKRATSLPLGIYVRLSQKPKNGKAKSTDAQAPSIERQLRHCRELAGRLGVPVAVYNESITSAYKGKRPVYNEMISDLRAGRIAGVICWHADRLHRNNRELLDWIDLSTELDFPTHTVSSGLMDLSTANGRAAAITLGAWARAESEHRSERTRDGMEAKMLGGEFLGGKRPFGYEADGIAVRTEEAEELAKATARIVAGDSLRSILMDWNARDILTTNGKQWTYPSLTAVLTRVRNVGWVQHLGKTLDGVKAQWDAIVPVDDFLAAQKILSDPKRRTTPGSARVHLLGGIVRCGKCGKPMQSGSVRDRTKKRYEIYRCCVYRSAPQLERWIELATLVLLNSKEARKLLTPQKADGTKLERGVTGIHDDMKKAAQACAEGRITLPQLEILNQGYTERLDALTAQLADSTRVKVLGGLISKPDLAERWKELSLSRKRAVISSLFDITVKPVGRGSKAGFIDGLTIKLRNEIGADFPIGDLFGEFGMVVDDGISTEQYREIVRTFAA
jgi:DNA invertase Pin-like site-specific DNA recombinase